MAAVIIHNDLASKEITVPLTTGAQTIDLSSLLEHDDPKIVVIVGTNTVTGVMGVYPVGSLMAFKTRNHIANSTMISPSSLNGSNQVVIHKTAATQKFYLHAEFGGDSVTAHSDGVACSYTANTWTKNLLSGGGDGEFAITRTHFNNGGNWGCRSLNSVNPNTAQPNQSHDWGVVKVQNDGTNNVYWTYQNRSGKTPTRQVYIYEMGYMSSDCGWNHMEDDVDEVVTTVGSWDQEGITGTSLEGNDSADADIALMHIDNANSSNRDAWVREISGSEATKKFPNNAGRRVLASITASEYEYYISHIDVNNYVQGFFIAPAVTGVDVSNISGYCRLEEPTTSDRLRTKE